MIERDAQTIIHECANYSTVHNGTHVEISQLGNKMFATALLQTCQQVVTMLLFNFINTRLSLTTC
jgi:inorganic pyrophosphatase